MGDIIEAEFQLQIDDGSLREVNLLVQTRISCIKFSAHNIFTESPEISLSTFVHFGHLGSRKISIFYHFSPPKKHILQVGCKVCEFFSICKTQNQEKVIERLQVKTKFVTKQVNHHSFSRLCLAVTCPNAKWRKGRRWRRKMGRL